ncbi:MAG: hypothetical protein LBS86_06940 [Treponema sp.]|jgi:hypothetical protein|nr:hypothetical protein [Treponema sp.]
MHIKRGMVAGLLPALLLSAAPLIAQQEVNHTEPDVKPNTYFAPESGLARASSSTLLNDIDRFISVRNFRDISGLNSFFGYLGFTPDGLNLGYSANLGTSYIAIGYGGSLIEDLFARIINGTPQDVNVTTVEGDDMTTSHRISDSNNNPLGNAKSKNALSVMFGRPKWGLKIDFSHQLSGSQSATDSVYRSKYSDQTGAPIATEERLSSNEVNGSFESGLAFFGELGLVLGIFRPSLRFGIDVHQLSSSKIITVSDESNTVGLYKSEYLSDFNEPSVGLGLGFRFMDSDTGRLEAGLIYDLSMRLFKNNNEAKSKVRTVSNDDVASLTPYSLSVISEMSYIRNHIVPSISFGGRISRMISVGGKVSLDTNYDVIKEAPTIVFLNTQGNLITDYDTLAAIKAGESKLPVKTSYTVFSMLPEVDLGANFDIIPRHLSAYAGLGLSLYSMKVITTTKDDEGKVKTKSTAVPTSKIAGGVTVNFTRNVAMDMLLVASGFTFDMSKFSMLFYAKF